jgi:hypothetical protein
VQLGCLDVLAVDCWRFVQFVFPFIFLVAKKEEEEEEEEESAKTIDKHTNTQTQN